MNRSESKYFNTAIRMDEALIKLMETQEFSYISVKAICETAGVNRSTFYLHYENMADLLEETMQYIMDSFLKYFESSPRATIEKIGNASTDELLFVTEDYLIPYLQFVQKNKRIYRAAFENKVYEANLKYRNLYLHIIEPIMARFDIPKEERSFLSAFYIYGITGMVKEWIETGCKESVEEVAHLIIKIVMKKEESTRDEH